MSGNSLEVSITDIRLIKDFREVFGFSEQQPERTFISKKGVSSLMTILARKGLMQVPEQFGQFDTVRVQWLPEERKCLFSIFAGEEAGARKM